MNRFEIITADITTIKVQAVVNAANNTLLGGGRVDGAIHRAAGPALLEECRGLGGCPTGQARLTGGYRLPAEYVIHTVGPIWQGGETGEEQLLLEECRGLGGCPTGQARLTGGYRLPAEYVIHTVGPIWQGGETGEEQLLSQCYLSCLELAVQQGIKTIAFPSISTGAYHFPVNRAAEIAIAAIMGFLKFDSTLEKVLFVCHDERTAIVYHVALDQYLSKK